jgi:hypothetical protein
MPVMPVGGVRMMKMYASCSGFPSGGVIRALQANIKHMPFPPDRSSPFVTEDLPDMTRSWSLLSITGLAPLARLSGTDRTPSDSEASIIRKISPGSIIFLQPAMRASVLGCFSSLRPHCSYQRKGSAAQYLDGGRGGRAWSLLGWAGRTEEARRWVGVVTSWEGVSIRS